MAQLVWAGEDTDRWDPDASQYRCPEVYDLSDNSANVIGRGKASDLRVRQKLCSRRHAEITFAGGKWKVRDFSTNGTYVNGFRVRQVTIADKDLIAFGALGPLSGYGEMQENYRDSGTVFQFRLPKKLKRLTKKCEMCKKLHDGLWGSGRFCKQSCAAQYSRKRGSQATTSTSRKRSKASIDTAAYPKEETVSKRKKTSRPRRTAQSSVSEEKKYTYQKRRSRPASRDGNSRDGNSRDGNSRDGNSSNGSARRKVASEKKPDPVHGIPELEVPKPPNRKERFFRPSMMSLHLGSRVYKVEAPKGIKCYHSKDWSNYVRPEIIISHGTTFTCDEKSGSWVRVGRLWVPIEKEGKIVLKEDKKHRNAQTLGGDKPPLPQKKRAKRTETKDENMPPLCEICGKEATWGSGRFCGRSCAARMAAIANSKKAAGRNRKPKFQQQSHIFKG
ncbi:hypothetical protein AAMO2058_001059500 [Amorphochlora amoebiformis]